MPMSDRAVSYAILGLFCLGLTACALHRPERLTESNNEATPALVQAVATSPDERSWGRSLGNVAGHVQAVPVWEHYRLPGKEATQYAFVRTGDPDGRVSVQASSASSASMLRASMAVMPEQMGKFHFSWKVASLIEGADLGVRESDDAPARVVLAFDGDRSRFTTREWAMAELARTITGEEMPYATLMYVWCNQRPVGTVIVHPRSSRIRAIVVESGPARLGQWTAYNRDIRADYERAFGEPPAKLTGVALMTDSDNTRQQAKAWYGPLSFDQATVSAR
jgi:hypothetical protein